MREKQGRGCAKLIIMLAATLLFAGCGVKTDPVPPASVAPEAIVDLRYEIDEGGVRLTWTFPDRTINGDNISSISAFDVYRAVVDLDGLCDTCPIPFGEPTEIDGGETSVAGKRRMGEYRTSLLRSDHKYFYKIRARNSWWAASDDSNIVSFIWHVPASPPVSISAAASDTRISLSWPPVTTLLDGRPAEGAISYRVLRSENGKEFEPLTEPLAETGFIDIQVVNGRKYFYKVQSLLTYRDNVIDGGISRVIAAVPLDMTPPQPPTGIRAVRTGSGIKVFWEPGVDPEVAGYRVYRRLAGETEAVLVGEVESIYNIFDDRDIDAGATVYYSVSAFDQAQPANESERSAEVSPR
jgi:hypothetical protein